MAISQLEINFFEQKMVAKTQWNLTSQKASKNSIEEVAFNGIFCRSTGSRTSGISVRGFLPLRTPQYLYFLA